MSFKPLLISILLTPLILGCMDSTKIDFPDDDLRLTISESGIIVKECEIAKNSDLYLMLRNWFNYNEEQWKTAPATYLPDKLITASDFKANITINTIVVNDLWRKQATPEIYQSLVCDSTI
jgi:hypothetical protein